MEFSFTRQSDTRKNREKLRNMSSTILDYKKLVDDYLRVSDWRQRLS